MTKVGYLGIDQYGNHYNINKFPRKELLNQLGRTKARKMFVDNKQGEGIHSGYVIGEHWISLYTVSTWKEEV